MIEPQERIDYERILNIAKDYVEYNQSEKYHEDNDYANYIFETVLLAIY